MKRFISLTAGALLASLPITAQAAPIVNITGYSFPNGANTGVIHFTGSQFDNRAVQIGQFKLTGTEVPGGTPVSFITFCVDIFNVLAVPRLFEVTSLSQMYTGDRWTNINKILTNTSVTNATQSAAVQLALWEVAFETGSSFSVGNGAFSVTGGNSAAARTLANTYLGNLGSWNTSSTHKAKLLFSANSQSQVFLAAVPEPATWAMMIIGFGAIGFAMRRAKVRTTISYA